MSAGRQPEVSTGAAWVFDIIVGWVAGSIVGGLLVGFLADRIWPSSTPSEILGGGFSVFTSWGLLGVLIGTIVGIALMRLRRRATVGSHKTNPENLGERKCPFCAEWIKVEAIKCRYCMSEIEAVPVPVEQTVANDPMRPKEHPEFRCGDCGRTTPAVLSKRPVCSHCRSSRGRLILTCQGCGQRRTLGPSGKCTYCGMKLHGRR